MNIRLATQKDTQALKELWLEAFSDSKEFVDWNFKNNYCPQNVVLAEEDEALAAALHLAEYNVCLYGEDLKGVYVSAVATKKEYRGRGFASGILNFASSLCAERGFDLCFLVPAINGFYERFGYFSVCEKEEFLSDASLKTTENFEGFENLTKEKFFKIYCEANKNKAFYLKRSKKNSDMIFDDHRENTKGISKAFFDEGYILLGGEAGKTKIFELCAKTEAAKKALLKYAESFGKAVVWEQNPLMVKILSDKAPLKRLKTEAAKKALPNGGVNFNLVL